MSNLFYLRQITIYEVNFKKYKIITLTTYFRVLDYPTKTAIKTKYENILDNKPKCNFEQLSSQEHPTNKKTSFSKNRSPKREASKNASMKLNLQIGDQFYKPRNKKLVVYYLELMINTSKNCSLSI